MQCSRCQTLNRDSAQFCRECGARFAAACPACGGTIEPGSRFCDVCGVSLSTAHATTDARSRFGSPEAYTPKHLAERILTSKAALEGERKQVTVLFADLKGSMELLADRDPEQARALLDPVLEHMMEAVHCYEGTVNQVMGDGIMALFGAPVAHEDHAVRACYAALRMQDSVKRYAEDLRQRHGLDAQIRVGLNSGEVVVRSIGSDLRMDYTAVGQTVHLAARMEQFARPGTILMSPGTLRLAEDYVRVRELGPIPIKGLSEPVVVYEVIGTGPSRTRLQAAAARGLSHFVGRDPELARLREALDRAGSGQGQVVALIGEPGVGKSRLVWEFIHSHRTRGWLTLESSSVSYGRATPYLPVIDLLRGYFRILDRDDHREIREKVTGKILTLDEALKPTLPALLGLLDVPLEDARWQALDPPQRRRRTLEAVQGLLLRESQVQPLLVVFEDLHWIDSETQAVLDGLVEHLPTARILLLVNYRPEYQHTWGSKPSYSQLRLNPLAPENADALLLALVGNDASLQPLKRLLIERTEGNPFFLEESVRTLVETGVLSGERGRHRLVKPIEGIQVPATVQAVLAGRIDRLPAEDKRLLQSASVIGKDVPFALLRAIVEEPEVALRRHLNTLQAAEFLYEAKLFPDPELAFTHALTHEVAYGSLLQERRRSLHARIIESIERLYPDRLAEHVERLAHHAFRGELWEKAVVYLRQAGAKAAAHSAHEQAVSCLEQALVALGHLPESRSTSEQDIDLRFDLRNSLHLLGELGRIRDHLQEAKARAEALGDRRRLGWVFSYMTQCDRLMGEPDRAIETGQRALAMAGALGDFALEVATHTHLGPAYGELGEYRRAIEILTRNVERLQGDLLRERLQVATLPSVTSLSNLVCCLAEVGEFAEGAVRGEAGLRVAEAADDPYSLIFACFGLGTLHLVQGNLSQAIQVLERGLGLFRTWTLPLLFPAVASCLGSAYAWAGRTAEGMPLLEQAVEQAAAMKLMARRAVFLARLGEAYVLGGRLAEAIQPAEGAYQLAREQKERGHEAYALRLLGEIAAHGEPQRAGTAEDRYLRAMALATELGMRPLLAHCHLGLGRLYRRSGNEQQAGEHLTAATTLFREMGMGHWLGRGDAELSALP